ncbi:MAG: hypothetical protein JNJ55_09805 [Betaproteobacteria bacterium]|nr:hypothetical protein [Betaproteobacteria bacterium]
MRKIVCGAMVWIQLLLLSVSPLLHAHSAEPLDDPAGVHLFVPERTHTHTICAQTGDIVPIATVEVAEGRGLDDGVPDVVALPQTQVDWPADATASRSASLLGPLSATRPNPCCLRASPQAP